MSSPDLPAPVGLRSPEREEIALLKAKVLDAREVADNGDSVIPGLAGSLNTGARSTGVPG